MDDTDVLANIWEVLKAYIPEKERQIAADHLIPILVDLDLSESDFQALVKSDTYLEEAAEEYLEDELDEEDDWD